MRVCPGLVDRPEPALLGLHFTVEVLAENRVNEEVDGVVPGDFDQMTEVFVGGEVSGNVCVPIPGTTYGRWGSGCLSHPQTFTQGRCLSLISET